VSSKVTKMLRSWMLSADQLMARLPGKSGLILAGVRRYAEWLCGNAVYGRRWRQLLEILGLMLRYHPRIALRIITAFLPALFVTIARSKKHRLMLRRQGKVVAPQPRNERFPVGAIRLMEASD